MQLHVSSSSCLVDERTSSSSGDTMSGPGAWPSTHHGHSWNCPDPARAHARYCPLWPLSLALCTASGPVQKPAPSSSCLGSMGSPGRQPEPCLGARLGHRRWSYAPHVLTTARGLHAQSQAADHVALTTCQMGCTESNSLEEPGYGVASEFCPAFPRVPSEGVSVRNLAPLLLQTPFPLGPVGLHS